MDDALHAEGNYITPWVLNPRLHELMHDNHSGLRSMHDRFQGNHVCTGPLTAVRLE